VAEREMLLMAYQKRYWLLKKRRNEKRVEILRCSSSARKVVAAKTGNVREA